MEKMTERMTEIDDTIPELPAKDLVSTKDNFCKLQSHM